MDIALVVSNSILAGLSIAFGIYIRYLVTQQAAMKDATIAALQAALTAKSAEMSAAITTKQVETSGLQAALKVSERDIDRLKGEAAPNVAANYTQMREVAEALAAEKSKIELQLKRANDEIARQKATLNTLSESQQQAVEKIAEAYAEVGRAHALRETADMFRRILRNVQRDPETLGVLKQVGIGGLRLLLRLN